MWGNFRLDIQQLGCIIKYASDLEAREISLNGFRIVLRFSSLIFSWFSLLQTSQECRRKEKNTNSAYLKCVVLAKVSATHRGPYRLKTDTEQLVNGSIEKGKAFPSTRAAELLKDSGKDWTVKPVNRARDGFTGMTAGQRFSMGTYLCEQTLRGVIDYRPKYVDDRVRFKMVVWALVGLVSIIGFRFEFDCSKHYR